MIDLLLLLDCFQTKIPYAYFGVFDGHAGCGASLMAVNQLHFHIMEKLQGIKELLAYESDDKLAMAEELADAVVSSVTIDSLTCYWSFGRSFLRNGRSVPCGVSVTLG